MKMFGSKRLQTYIRTHCELAEKLGERIEKDDRFEVSRSAFLFTILDSQPHPPPLAGGT